MEKRAQISGCGEEEDRLAAFETKYRTLIDQHISPELATLAASNELSGTLSFGPRFTFTPHAHNNPQLTHQGPLCTTITQGKCRQCSKQNSMAFQIESKSNGKTARKISDIEKH